MTNGDPAESVELNDVFGTEPRMAGGLEAQEEEREHPGQHDAPGSPASAPAQQRSVHITRVLGRRQTQQQPFETTPAHVLLRWNHGESLPDLTSTVLRDV